MKPFYIITIQILLAGFISASGQQEQSDTINMLEPNEFYIKLHQSSNPLLLDVGEYKDYRKERIPGAVSTATYDELFSLTDTLDREQPIFIYCVYISRSITASTLLNNLGFSNVYVLINGIAGWKELELETDKKSISKREKKSNKSF
ncbi:MAG: rhodanese-like domain-containing protein [Bacteroidetes bacterium]|nr:rhodanese-like domain-containing protein [Bacteroidota bacterium]